MNVRHFILCLVIIWFPGSYLSACDHCGGSVSGSFSGLMAFNTSNFIGFGFSCYSFINQIEGEPGIESHFYSADLNGSVNINSNWQLFGYVPYKSINYSDGDQSQQLAGIGDAGIINTLTLFSNNKDVMRKFSYRVTLKAGLEFPTGHFNETFRGDQLPASVATGSGSFDAISGLQYRYQKNKINFIADYTIKYHTVNKSHYTFGAQQSLSVFISERTDLKKMRIMPYFGTTIELIGTDQFYDVQQSGTKGNFAFANVGFELGIKKISAGFSYDIPFFSDLGLNDDMTARGRCAFRLHYAF